MFTVVEVIVIVIRTLLIMTRLCWQLTFSFNDQQSGMPVLSTRTQCDIAQINSLSLPLQVFYVCFDRIASHVSIPTVVSLSRTNTVLINKLPSHLRRSFEDLLKSRISAHRVAAFCSLLLETRAVISGSTALHFVLRDSHWSPGDFDLYAPFGTGYSVVRWLVVNEGYRIVSDGSWNFKFRPATIPLPAGPCHWLMDLGLDNPLPATSSYSRRSKSHYGSSDSHIYRVYKLASKTNTFIDVIESSKPSFLPPITKFHSTLVMNYLTPKSLVVLYPHLTFRREAILQDRNASTTSYNRRAPTQTSNPQTGGRTKKDYVEKYQARGFTFYSNPAGLRRPCGAACPEKRRKVGDQADNLSVEIHFDTVHPSSGTETLYDEDLERPPANSEVGNLPDDNGLPTRGYRSSQFSSLSLPVFFV